MADKYNMKCWTNIECLLTGTCLFVSYPLNIGKAICC
ncbi:hypothetical protein NXW86_29755 [Bacteroides thetaiotaomicron]|nr:hypothetical protein [Bacteroides thetaiotaomicron]MCS2453152.1 hypothetical protein [Bacteroides thetaiotaomicron]